MSHKENKVVTRETIIGWIRRETEGAGGVAPTFQCCLRRLKIAHSRFYKYFKGWNDALREAGIDFEPRNVRIPLENLLADWGQVARKVGQVPVRAVYDAEGKYHAGTLRERFGPWAEMPAVFRKFAEGKKEWADVVALCDAAPRKGRRRSRPDTSRRKNPDEAKLIRGRTIYGGPLQLPGLASAPVNESGVIFLFGMLAWRLGFHVESLRPQFPDCEAKRYVGHGQWQRVTIEFEYESRNFSHHAHPPEDCDLIVCWEHNWTNCPKNLEVIALKDELARIRGATGHALVPNSQFTD